LKTAAEFFLKNLRFTMMCTFFVALAGYMSLSSLNSESFPNVNLGQVVILTYYRGATIEDIESKITKPLEDEIRSVTGIKRVRSISQPGISTIITEVDIDNYDVEEVVADLQRAIDSTSELPTDLEEDPAFIEIKVDEMPIIEVSVVGGESSFERNEVAFNLSEALEDNKKISTISMVGYQDPQFKIQLDLDKLKEQYISISEVTAAIQRTTVTIPAGHVENDTEKYLIKIDGKLKTKEEILKIAVRTSNSGRSILLKDIADVVLEDEKPLEKVSVDGKPATNLVIAKKASEDIIELATETAKTLEAYKKKYPNFDFIIYSDEGVRVGNRVGVLYSNALAGLALVIIFLLIFLSGRAGIMTAISLPLAVMATLVYMQVSGMSLNAITIMALIISIGMLVDNAVVISENFVRLTGDGEPPLKAALDSIASLWAPVTATALTTISAFLPMMVTKGIMGEFIIGIPLIVTASLLFSLFESFFFLPARLVLTAKKNVTGAIESTNDWFSDWAHKNFKPFVKKCIQRRWLTMGALTALIFSSLVFMGVFNKFILFPASQTEIYVGRLTMPEQSPIDKTNNAVVSVTEKIRKTLGDSVKNIVGTSGTSRMDWSDPKGKTATSVAIVKIFMTEEAKNSLVTEDVLKELRTIEDENVLRLEFEAMVNGPPVGDPVTLRIRSSNDGELEAATNEMLKKMSTLEGLVDLRVNEQQAEPEVKLSVDIIKAQSLGLSLAEVGFTFQTAFSGIPVNDVNINNRDVDYFIELKPEDKDSIDAIMNIEVANNFGKKIPVSNFAEIKESDSSAFIERYDYKRAKTITAGVETEKITSVVANAKALEFFNEIKDQYPTVTMVFGGEAENTAESMESLSQAMILAVIGIFALLILVFNSFSTPFIVLSTVPLGLVGVAYAFFLQGLPISFLAMIGVVGLSGIIVNSGIVLISFIEERRESNPEEDLEEILAESSVVRLKAVVITSLTTISGLFPTAYGIGGSDEFIRPMAMSIAWGLVSGTILTLIWVPCAYMILNGSRNKLAHNAAFKD
jgi:multidrug efflux pump subunit AcrB